MISRKREKKKKRLQYANCFRHFVNLTLASCWKHFSSREPPELSRSPELSSPGGILNPRSPASQGALSVVFWLNWYHFGNVVKEKMVWQSALACQRAARTNQVLGLAEKDVQNAVDSLAQTFEAIKADFVKAITLGKIGGAEAVREQVTKQVKVNDVIENSTKKIEIASRINLHRRCDRRFKRLRFQPNCSHGKSPA